MFTLSLENQMRYDAAQRWYFPEEEVEQHLLLDWVHDLLEYFPYIPKQFHTAIEDKTIVTNKKMFNEFYKWCASEIASIESLVPEEKYLNLDLLNTSAHKIFEGTLHDAIIEKITRKGQQITLHISGTSGWNAYSFVTLTFEGVINEAGEIGHYYIYDQILWTGEHFAFRLLSDNPYKEWTIFFQNAQATVAYDPIIREQISDYTSAKAYVEALNDEHTYAVKIDGELQNCLLSQFEFNEELCFFNGICLGHSAKEVAAVIYTYIYENPYAYFSVPVPLEEIYEAAMSCDLELRVRAFNTLYAEGVAYANVANQILRDSVLNEDNEMILSVIAGHFDTLGILDDDNKKKYKIG